jgi:hypothetical protein
MSRSFASWPANASHLQADWQMTEIATFHHVCNLSELSGTRKINLFAGAVEMAL